MRYKLLRDLPWAKAGTIYKRSTNPTGSRYYYPATPNGYCLGEHIRTDQFIGNESGWFAPVDERFRPEGGDNYWCVKEIGEPLTSEFAMGHSYERAFAIGNCFRTEEEAQEAARRVKQTLMAFHKELNA